MPRYDVYPAAGGQGYLVDLQTDLLDGLNTRVVAPLLPEAVAPTPARTLDLIVEIGGTRHVLATQFLAAVPTAILGTPVASLAARAEEITRAVDMLFQGF